MVPVIDTGTDDDHAFSFGHRRCIGPFARKLQDCLGIDSGENLLPGRRVGGVFIRVVLRIISGQAAADAVLSHDQIVNSSDGHLPVDGLGEFDRHASERAPVHAELDKFNAQHPVIVVE